ncbi:MAG: ferrous iron transport protein A [Proteobacteria bacterium]|nr:ferrous iron transport protein A [Pseudomonadota bacterium]
MDRSSLRNAKKGQRFRIFDVVEGHPLSNRLVELGLCSGEWVTVVHEAPLSRDPIVLDVSGTRIALRRTEAALIIVDESSAQ